MALSYNYTYLGTSTGGVVLGSTSQTTMARYLVAVIVSAASTAASEIALFGGTSSSTSAPQIATVDTDVNNTHVFNVASTGGLFLGQTSSTAPGVTIVWG